MQQRRNVLTKRKARVKVASSHGMHARPVTQFVQLANEYEAKIEVTNGDSTVDGKSVAAMMTLGAGAGTELGIIATGPDAAKAVKALAKLIATDLDADLEPFPKQPAR